MPIESLQSRAPVTAPTPVDGGGTSLPLGTIEARVTASLENGLARFATSFGFVDLVPPQPLAVGTRAQLLVENTGIRILLTQLGSATAGQAGASAAATSQTTAQPLPLATPATPQPGRLAPDPVAAQLAAAARTATATQQSPAMLLSRLVPMLAQASRGLPADVQRAAAQVLAMPLRADQPLDPAVLQAALRQSGLFREARGTSAGPDWKQALITLRSALASWAPHAPATPAGETAAAMAGEGQPGIPPSTRAAGQSEAATAPTTAVPQPAGQAAARPPSSPAAGGSAPGEAAEPGEAEAAAGRPLVSAQAMPPPDGAPDTDRPATAALLSQLVARAFGAQPTPAARAGTLPSDAKAQAEPGGAVVPLPLRERAAPPRADQSPRALHPEVAPDQWLQADATTHRDTLLAMTDAALDRVRLSQFASLPRDQTQAAQPQPGQPQHPAWVFDVPLLLGREAAVAQFRVTRDGRGPGAEAAAVPRWSIDVAIDTSETGPVHARVRLGGGAIGVTLWAERPDMVERLRQDMPALRQTLDAAAFTVDDVAILAGSPQAQPARTSGYFLDTRS